MLLQLRNIARFYGSRLIFKDVSLELGRGGVTLLAGSNGAGKSTLLKIMAGLLRPSAGEVVYAEGARGEIPRIGYLGHQTFLYPELSALENLRFWAALHGGLATEKDFSEILERVELAPFAGEKAKGFSRGMAQRLNLARVFLLAPEILLLDEPGTGLDIRSTAVLHREVAAAKEAGAGVVWITHSLEGDMARADKIALLEERRLRFYGSTEAFRNWRNEAETGAAREDAPEAWQSREARGGEPC